MQIRYMDPRCFHEGWIYGGDMGDNDGGYMGDIWRILGDSDIMGICRYS